MIFNLFWYAIYKIIESLRNTRIYFRYFKAIFIKNGSTKYRKLIEHFSQNLGGVEGRGGLFRRKKPIWNQNST